MCGKQQKLYLLELNKVFIFLSIYDGFEQWKILLIDVKYEEKNIKAFYILNRFKL